MSTTALKFIALLLMTIDHIGVFLPDMPIVLRWIGRLSAPIFVYCVVQGFAHTKSRQKYMLRLYLAGILMELLNRLVNWIAYITPEFSSEKYLDNNIFRTLFCISVLCFLIDSYQRKNPKFKKYLALYGVWQVGAYLILFLLSRNITPSALSESILVFLPNLFGSIYYLEGGWIFLLLGALFYYAKNSKKALAIGYSSFCLVYFLLTVTQFVPRVFIKLQYFAYLLSDKGYEYLGYWILDLESFLSHLFWTSSGLNITFSAEIDMFLTNYQWMMIGVLPILLLYNGQKGKGYKYLFYVYYPFHLVVLYVLGGVMRGMG